MKRRVAAIAAVALLAVAGTAFAQTTVTVSTADQFVKAIGSNKTIVMKPGTYTIGKTNTVKNQAVRYDKTDGGYQLNIVGVKNLKITAESGDVGIVGVSAYAWPLSFEDCETITLNGLTVGHEATEGCMAGVLRFVGCNEVFVGGCDLYGSGSIGIWAESCGTISVNESSIHDCSEGAARFMEVSGATLENVSFENNAAYPLLGIYASDFVYFTSCYFSGNDGDTFVEISAEGDEIEDPAFTYCTITDNTIAAFASDRQPILEECDIGNNDFGDPVYGDEGEYGDYPGEGEEFGYYINYASGLQLTYPSWWTTREDYDNGNGLVYLPGTDSGVLVFPVYDQPQGANDLKAMKKNQAAMLKAYVDAMKKTGNMTVSVKQSGDFFEIDGLAAIDYRGTAQYAGKKLFVWARFVLTGEGGVFALSAVTADEAEFAEGAELNSIMMSCALAPRGE